MAETGQEKTEQATGKKLSESRERGSVAKSVEISSLAVFTAGLLSIFLMQKHISKGFSELSIKIFSDLNSFTLTKDSVQGYAIKGILFYFYTLGPIFAIVFIAALAANYGQIGFKITPKSLAPKLSKFNPLSNLKNIFFSTRSIFELSKSILKFLVIGYFTYSVLEGIVFQSLGLVDFSVEEIVNFMMDAGFTLLWKIVLVYALLAGIDFAYQKFKFKKDMMMTKQEVKEENRETEGDPHVKGKIRSIQIATARQRMMKEVPKADVVITNPTHFAIALKYEAGRDNAPKVIAKGVDELAQRIKKVAAENNIPLHEDRQLARALYKACDIGDEIPHNLFQAVAQILAYIFKLKNVNKKKSIV